MKRLIVILTLSGILLMNFTVFVNASNTKSYTVIIADTGEILESENAHLHFPMASTTKIMTAITVIENCEDLKKIFTVPAEACNIEGSSIYLYENEEISIETLLYGLLLNSGNDAAVALAISTSGSVEKFVDLMNDNAKKIGLKDTNYENPHGLDGDNHYTSSYDLALLLRYAMKNNVFAKITGTISKSFEMSDGTTRYFTNHNKLLKNYKFAKGGKNGFTKLSGRCLATYAEKDGVALICATIHADDDFEFHQSMYEKYFDLVKLEEIPITSYKLNCVGGNADIIEANEKDKLIIPIYDRSILNRIDKTVIAEKLNYAPIKCNECVGYVIYKYGEIEFAKNSIYSDVNIEKTENKSIFKKIIEFFRRLFSKI